MSILAAPRYKKKIAPDPQNLKWKNDDNKIGQKMMEKMGWKDGKGLGKDEQGMKNNIKLKANYTQKGLKCGEEEINVDKTWMSHHDEFSVLLEKLKSKKAVVEDESSDTEEDERNEKEKKINGKSIEEKVRNSKRFFYRRIQMKDLTRYSEKDKSAVIGIRKKIEKITKEEIPKIENVEEPKLEKSSTIQTSTVSISDYFATKMSKFYAKKQEKKEMNGDDMDEEIEDEDEPKSFKKSKKFTDDDDDEQVENYDDEIPKKKSKKNHIKFSD